jgi:hypothetical protein
LLEQPIRRSLPAFSSNQVKHLPSENSAQFGRDGAIRHFPCAGLCAAFL